MIRAAASICSPSSATSSTSKIEAEAVQVEEPVVLADLAQSCLHHHLDAPTWPACIWTTRFPTRCRQLRADAAGVEAGAAEPSVQRGQFTPAAGTVTLLGRAPGGRRRDAASDTGVGIARRPHPLARSSLISTASSSPAKPLHPPERDGRRPQHDGQAIGASSCRRPAPAMCSISERTDRPALAHLPTTADALASRPCRGC